MEEEEAALYSPLVDYVDLWRPRQFAEMFRYLDKVCELPTDIVQVGICCGRPCKGSFISPGQFKYLELFESKGE